MFTRELSIKIWQMIDERGMTLEELAEAAGLCRKFVGNIASEKQVPTLDSFEKICSALEVEPNDLLISSKSKLDGKAIPMCVDTLYQKIENGRSIFLPICPSCNMLLHNNWQSYCDNCGQKLSWKEYVHSKVISEKPKRIKSKG